MAKMPPAFPRRLNNDGTYDSICNRCFKTLATSSDETELLNAEQAHICPGFNMENIFLPGF
jgi:hypothetical protein